MKRKIRIAYGLFNYSISLVILLLPAIINFKDFPGIAYSFFAGTAGLVLHLLCSYELGKSNHLSFRFVLSCSFFLSTFTLFSPFLLNFYQVSWGFFLFAGTAQLGFTLYAYVLHFARSRRRNPVTERGQRLTA